MRGRGGGFRDEGGPPPFRYRGGGMERGMIRGSRYFRDDNDNYAMRGGGRGMRGGERFNRDHDDDFEMGRGRGRGGFRGFRGRGGDFQTDDMRGGFRGGRGIRGGMERGRYRGDFRGGDRE